MSIEQIKKVVSKQESKLTGSDLSAMCREVMGTCVAMRVKVEGAHDLAELEQGFDDIGAHRNASDFLDFTSRNRLPVGNQ